MAAAPIVLEMDVHCRQCAKKIRKSVRDMFGVERVSASAETGMVVVHGGGDVDATILQRLLQRAMGRPVIVVSDGGGRDGREISPMYFDGMRQHMMPPTQYAPQHPPPYAGSWDRSPYADGPSTAYPYPQPQHWSTPPAPPPPHPYAAYPPGVYADTSRGNSCSIM